MIIVTLFMKLIIGFLLTRSVYSTNFSLTPTKLSNIYNGRNNSSREMGENGTEIQNELNSKENIKKMNHHNSVEFTETLNNKSNNIILSRVHRSIVKNLIIEVTVFVDLSMQRHYGQELEKYIERVMYIVAGVFRDSSIGNSIDIALVEIVKLDSTSNFHIFGHVRNTDRHDPNGLEIRTQIDAHVVLKKFCTWQSVHGDGGRYYFEKNYDAAILITRHDICNGRTANGPCSTRGLAGVGVICNRNNSCTVVQDEGLSTALTIGHEFGHLLSLEHDNEAKCSKQKQASGEDGVFIMNSGLGSPKWSICSRSKLTKFIDSGQTQCLENRPRSSSKIFFSDRDDRKSLEKLKLPGLIYNAHQQCRLATGKIQSHTNQEKVTNCSRMFCIVESTGLRFSYPNAWADGTSCMDSGNSTGKIKWCIGGKCVDKTNNEDSRIIHGGWGGWSEPSNCSRACNGGIRTRTRECNKPTPRNGGRYCLGERVSYESCNTWNCGECFSEFDFRAEQCKKFNGNNFNYPGVSSQVIWTPLETEPIYENRCKLKCVDKQTRYYYWLNMDNVIDGTKCDSSGQNFDMCVNGKCVQAGCDHVMFSTKKLDVCGVCGGDNSTCKIVNGMFNNRSSDPQEVVRIPMGAFAIRITQRSEIKPNTIPGLPVDDNHLMVVDPASNETLLNGNRKINPGSLEFNASGVLFYYTGISSVVETIWSSPLPTMSIESDLVIKVFHLNNQKYIQISNPHIHYEYYISKTAQKKKKKIFCPSRAPESNTTYGKTFSNLIFLSITIFLVTFKTHFIEFFML